MRFDWLAAKIYTAVWNASSTYQITILGFRLQSKVKVPCRWWSIVRILIFFKGVKLQLIHTYDEAK